MRRSFKYRLCPNKTQLAVLASSLETHRRIYNDALWKLAYEYRTRLPVKVATEAVAVYNDRVANMAKVMFTRDN